MANANDPVAEQSATGRDGPPVPAAARGSWKGLGAAFLVGIAMFFLAFQAMRVYRGNPQEPLVPPGERQAGSFSMEVLGHGGEPPSSMPEVGSLPEEPEAPAAPWTLEGQRGKVVVLNFFATWCPPCVAETPELVKISQEYGPRGVVFAAVGLDQDDAAEGVPREQVLREFVKRHALPYPVLLPARDSMLWANTPPIPQTFIFDRQGRRAMAEVGQLDGPTLRRWLDELLKEPS
jgi:thiol-disulfide isomerase/thioredoxin